MRQPSGAGTRCQLPVFRGDVAAAILGRDCRAEGWCLTFKTASVLELAGAKIWRVESVCILRMGETAEK
jgi:hypothetical protein